MRRREREGGALRMHDSRKEEEGGGGGGGVCVCVCVKKNKVKRTECTYY